MFKYVLSAFICLAFAMPAAAQCGCDAAPSCGANKRLGFVTKKRCLPQISMKCETNACGCSRRKLSLSMVQVDGASIGLVDRKPRCGCGGGLLGGGLLSGGLLGGGGGCGCGAPAPAPCGCGAAPAPAPACGGGCDPGDIQIDPPLNYADPVSAPAADCGCNG